MPHEHKTLEQRIADIEFNLKKLRKEITNAYISWEAKIVLEQSPTQPSDQPKQPPPEANSGPTEEKAVTYQTGRRQAFRGVDQSDDHLHTAGSFVPAVDTSFPK
jgi:hypothetical protein